MSTVNDRWGRQVTVDGRVLCVLAEGQGGPAVVFAPGAGLTGRDFLNVHQAAAQRTTSVIYDRGGTGWSDPLALPRSAADAAGEMRAMLAAAGVAPPYILVGHSLGGAYIRRFAQLWPDEVAGLLFLDAAHEGFLAEPPTSLRDQVGAALRGLRVLVNLRGFYRPMFERMLAGWPDDVRDALVEHHIAGWRRNLAERANLMAEVIPEIAGGGPLPPVPLIVLTAMGIDPFMAAFSAEAPLRALNERKRHHYDALAAEVPGGENRLVEGAGHSTLHTDRPDAVIDALDDLLTSTPSDGIAFTPRAGAEAF
jgi:pimeloyl-ACP methyl ester carboxylesterase